MSAPADDARFLKISLRWAIAVHVAGLVTVLLFLLPGLPGGPPPEAADRAADVARDPARPRPLPPPLAREATDRAVYVARSPWLWRLGWLPWHFAALVNVVLGLALVATRWIPRAAAWLTLLVTLCAAATEQTGEISWVTTGVDLAAEVEGGDPEALPKYVALESTSFALAAVWGASLYMVMAAGWTWCFVAAGTWSRTLTVLSVFTWGSLAAGSLGQRLPEAYKPGEMVIAGANAVGFPLLCWWLWEVLREVKRRPTPSSVGA